MPLKKPSTNITPTTPVSHQPVLFCVFPSFFSSPSSSSWIKNKTNLFTFCLFYQIQKRFYFNQYFTSTGQFLGSFLANAGVSTSHNNCFANNTLLAWVSAPRHVIPATTTAIWTHVYPESVNHVTLHEGLCRAVSDTLHHFQYSIHGHLYSECYQMGEPIHVELNVVQQTNQNLHESVYAKSTVTYCTGTKIHTPCIQHNNSD